MVTCLLRPNNLRDREFKNSLLISIFFLIIYTICEIFIFTPDKFHYIYPIKKAIGVFLTYIIFKEMEPDYFYNRNLAVIACGIVLIMYEKTGILPMIIFLLSIRFFVRSAGAIPTFVDYVFLCLIGMLGLLFYSYIFTLYLGGILIFDYVHKKSRIYSLILGGSFVVVSVMAFFKIYNITLGKFQIYEMVFVVVVAIMYCLRLSFMKNILTMSDDERYYLSPSRLKLINFTITITMVIYVLSYGDISSVLGLLSVMFFSAFPFLNDLLLQNKNKNI